MTCSASARAFGAERLRLLGLFFGDGFDARRLRRGGAIASIRHQDERMRALTSS